MFEPFVPFQRLRMFAATSTQKCILSSDTSAELLRAFIIFGLERPMTKHQSGWYQKCGKASLENIMLKPPGIRLDVPQTTPMPPAPSQSLEARNGPGTDSTGWAWSFVAQLLLFLCFCCFSLILWIISSSSSHLFFWLWINSELHAVPGIAINTEVSENLLHGGRGPGPTC